MLIASYWFGINFLWGSFLGVVLPFLLVPEHPGAGNPSLVPAADKNTALAILETAGLVLAFFVQPAAGAWSDRLRTRWGRRRPLIAVGTATAVVSLILVNLAQVFWLLLIGYCALQMFMNIAQGGYQGLLPDIVPGADRGEASGFLGLASLAGQVAGYISALFLAPHPQVFVTAAVLGFCGALVVWRVKEDPRLGEVVGAAAEGSPGDLTEMKKRDTLRGYLREFTRYPDFCWVVASRFLTYTGLACIQRFAANFLRDSFRDYSVFGFRLSGAASAAAALFAIVIFFGLLATYPSVKLSDRIGRRPVIVASSLLGAFGSTMFFFAPSLTVVLMCAIPIGVSFGMLVSVDWAYMADLAPRARAGKFLGFSNIAATGAQAFAPLALGPIIDLINRDGGSTGYKALFATSAVFFVAGALVLSRVRVQRIPEADEDLAATVLPTPA